MKKITQIGCLWLCYLLTFSATAQNDESSDEFGKLNIGIVMPEELDGFTSIHLQKLETKILSLLNQSGIASRGGSSGIVMYPVISIFNEQQINPGIQTMTVIEGEISLFIKQVDDKFVFASHTAKSKEVDVRVSRQSITLFHFCPIVATNTVILSRVPKPK